jgi:hypothetical protein
MTAWLDQVKVKLGGMEDFAPSVLRVTMIFRPEDGTWKVVHRHADPGDGQRFGPRAVLHL